MEARSLSYPCISSQPSICLAASTVAEISQGTSVFDVAKVREDFEETANTVWRALKFLLWHNPRKDEFQTILVSRCFHDESVGLTKLIWFTDADLLGGPEQSRSLT